MKDLSSFGELIQSCETLAERDPGAYRLRVFLLALLGFAFVFVLCALTLGLGLVMIAGVAWGHAGGLIKLAIIPLAFSWTLLRAMLGRVSSPEGVPVTRATAPALFAEIDDARRKLHALPVHRVLVDPESFNAGVAQIPRLGILGWPRNYLVIGLPCLEALTLDEFRFVLGHELGHLSRKQARFRNWIYRMRQSWPRLQASVAANHRFASGLITRFLDWYAPYFNAYTFVLARANEYDADRAGADLTSAETASRALTATYAIGPFLDTRIWGNYLKRAATAPEPPRAPFSEYLRLARETPLSEFDAGLRIALSKKTSLADTHPSLSDRLGALGQSPHRPQAGRPPASVALLGPLRAQLIAETDAKWAERIAARWTTAHERSVELRSQLASYADKAETLDAPDLFKYASLLEEAEGAASARPWLDAALARGPGFAPALFMRGRLRLSEGDAGGAPEIEQAMRADPEAVELGSSILYRYFLGQRDIARCQPYLENLKRIQRERQEAQTEWSKTLPGDAFAPFDMEPGRLEPFARALAANKKIKRAWLVRKMLKLSPGRRAYVAVVEFSWLCKVTQQELQNLLNALPQEVDRRVVTAKSHKHVARAVRTVEGAFVYVRR